MEAMNSPIRSLRRVVQHLCEVFVRADCFRPVRSPDRMQEHQFEFAALSFV